MAIGTHAGAPRPKRPLQMNSPSSPPRHGDVLPADETESPDADASFHVSNGKPRAVWRVKVPSDAHPPDSLRTKNPTVSVVIPALNEAKNLGHVLSALLDGTFEVILVDGASVDATNETVQRLRPDARVVQRSRSGKGNAFACDFAASRGKIIVIVTLDADGSNVPGQIYRFVDALVDGADHAKGSRALDGGGSTDIVHVRSLGNRFLMFLCNRPCKTKYTDLCHGYNAFWAVSCLPVLDVDSESPSAPGKTRRLWGDGFEMETLMNIRVTRAGLTAVGAPSYEVPRLRGASNLKALREGLRVLRAIVMETRRPRLFIARTRSDARWYVNPRSNARILLWSHLAASPQ